jgi:hypothetical protein
MSASEFRTALLRYAYIRQVVYDVAAHAARHSTDIDVPIRFAEIDAVALDAWRATWNRPQPFGYGGWDWEAIARPIWRRPAGLTLSIWSADQLCGLLAGRPSRRRRDGRRHTLSLYYLEGNPNPDHALRGHVAELALSVAELYAEALGTVRVRLVQPLPGVYRIYARLGYRIVQHGGTRVYFEKRMGADEQARP